MCLLVMGSLRCLLWKRAPGLSTAGCFAASSAWRVHVHYMPYKVYSSGLFLLMNAYDRAT